MEENDKGVEENVKKRKYDIKVLILGVLILVLIDNEDLIKRGDIISC